MVEVGVLSDTHGKLPPEAVAALAECDHIIHAGGIGAPGVLFELEALAVVTAVLGNNDFDEYGRHVGRFAHPAIDGVRFLVAHYPRDVKITFAGSAALAPGDPLPQVCIHGHTHIPALTSGSDTRPATLLICPGSVSRPRGGFPRCIARLQVENGRVLSAWIEALDGRRLMEWQG